MNTTTYKCPSNWLNSKINITLVGAGGTGSNLYDALVNLHFGLLALGHPHGIEVTLYDMDSVDLPNIGRQRFTYADIGGNKALTLVNRYNLAYGLNWTAKPERFEAKSLDHRMPDVLITCVDTVETRREIGQYLETCHQYESDELWMDYGNSKSFAQCITGHMLDNENRLPNVYDLYKELDTMEEDNEPSCSLAEALQSQDLYINRTIADTGINILWQLLRTGEISHHGAFIDLRKSETKPLEINTDVWEFMGYKAA